VTENETSSEIVIEDASIEPPDKAFDRSWAMTVLEQALKTLRDEFEGEQNGKDFEMLKPWLTGESAGGAAEAAHKLQMSEGAFRVATHRLRQRFRSLVRRQIALTVNDPKEVGAEMQYLIEALS
jgi:RNA polymerase sigma-70 factor (ECF subfamily)